MKPRFTKWAGAGLGLLLLVVAAPAQNLLTNGRFQRENFSDWTMFTTPDGSLSLVSGLPSVLISDIDGNGSYFDDDGMWSYISRYQVQRTSTVSPRAGGGIYQNFHTAGGWATVHADIYAHMPFNFIKPDPGLFSISVDGLLLDEFDFALERGAIHPEQVFAAALEGQLWLTPGVHELRVLMQSSALNDGSASFQYLDNISVTVIPEPGTFALLGLGGLTCARWRQRPTTAGSRARRRFSAPAICVPS